MKVPNMHVPETESDAIAFSGLTKRNKRLWCGWSQEFERVADGDGSLEERLKRAAKAMNVSYGSARRIWDKCLVEGWRGAIDLRSQQRADESSVPPRFWQYFKTMCEKEARSCSSAFNHIVLEWQMHKDLPGYDEWPPPSPLTDLPAGWSIANFMRHAPTRYELKAMRIGRSAAAEDRPLILTTREGLEVGQIVMFDDMWHNMLCNWVGVAKEGIRPLELCCHDVASACRCLHLLRPRVRDAETGKYHNITEKDMRLMVVAYLYLIGWRPEGTFFTVEGGTATIRDTGPFAEFAHMLKMVTGGAVKIIRGGIQDASTVMGGWTGLKRGNPRLKASLESLHRLYQDSVGLLPGQTGSNNRENKPERLAGMDAYNEQLLREVDKLPVARLAEMVELLRFPYPHWLDYTGIVRDCYRWTNNRKLHKLEGWEANKWIAQEYRMEPDSDLWLPKENLLALPAPRQDAIMALIEQPGYTRIRKLSPLEVHNDGRRRLNRLRPEHVPMLLGPDLAVERRLDKHYCFVIQGHEYGLVEPLRYPAARVRNVLGQDVILDPSRPYAVFPLPADMDHLFVCDTDLRFIGVCDRQVPVSRAKMDEIHRAIGQAEHARVALDAPLRARHQEEATDREQMIAHNALVLEDAKANAAAINVDSDQEPVPAGGDRGMDYLLKSAGRRGE